MFFLQITIAAFLSCYILCFVLRQPAQKLGLVDRPNIRKHHIGTVPLIGGVAIFITFLGFFLVGIDQNLVLISAVTLLVALGIIDDMRDLPAIIKLTIQIVAALILMLAGDTKITSLGSLPNGQEFLLGIWAYPLTIIAIVGLINAINMIDGLDGLAGCLTLLALVHLGLAMQLIDHPLNQPTLIEIVILAGAVSGFLVFNLGFMGERKIFLGDAGSMILGLLLAYYLITASQREPLIDTLPTSLVPWIVALPVIDTLSLIYRRLRDGRSPLSPDRMHLHHLLLDIGLSPRRVLLTMLGMAVLLFWTGFLISRWNSILAGTLFIILPIIYYCIITRKLVRNAAKNKE